MAEIEIQRIEKFSDFLKGRKRNMVLPGGAGAGKSYSVAQRLIELFCTEEDRRFLITRKTFPSLRITSWDLILNLLGQYTVDFHVNKSEFIISYGENKMLFKSLDEPEKIRSYDTNYIWAEETTELTLKDLIHLGLSLRRKTDTKNQIFFTFNPISDLHFLHKKFVEEFDPETTAIMYSNWEDNPFLDQDSIDELLALEGKDKQLHRVYTLGKWGVLENIVYSNYTITSAWPTSFDEIIYGLDFGFNSPTALIEIGYKDDVPYKKELIYETKYTNVMLIEELGGLGISKSSFIFADSQEPARIEDICNAGYNCHPASKGKGSVNSGIDFLRGIPCYVYSGSTNLIKEYQNYKHKEDKQGNALEEPVKWMDHLMDADRMAEWSYKMDILGPPEGGVYVAD